MTDQIDCVVAGAGVIGLAIARALAIAGREVLVLEEAGAIGTVTSSRNSEVIHAGLYYPPGSLRARFCVQGRRQLYGYCQSHGVPVRACGKLVVATDDAERTQIDSIAARAEANGVERLERLSAAQALAMEPALSCTGALFSPVTGIIDSHAYMLSLRGEAEDHGALFAFHARLDAAEITKNSVLLHTANPEPAQIACRLLINAAGLGACALASRIDGLDPSFVPPFHLAKGSYFTLSGRSPFTRLIYPVPIPGGAGIHLTLDIAGSARFGPDVEPVETIDYRVNPARAEAFAAAIRRYWPGLPNGALQPGYAGIRPKIVPPTQAQDFVIQGPADHHIPGLINLFGIESPGLTSSLAIADHVASLAAQTQ